MSRVENTLKNAKVNIVFYAIMTFVAFFSRKYFIQYLGDDVVGLTSMMINVLGFFNLAELGISSAISYSLYKPISANDRKEINHIISLFGYMYRKVGSIIFISAILFSFFLTVIFKKSGIETGYIFSAFLIYLFSSLLGYFVNYKQILIAADQKNYLILTYFNATSISKTVIQILCLKYTSQGFYLWIAWEAAFAIINSILLNYRIKKDYPWLSADKNNGKHLIKKYTDIISRIKQIFVHTFANFVLNQTDVILIYFITNLSIVTVFTNYTMIMNKMTSFVASVFSNSFATVGNLIAENDEKKIIRVFWEWMSVRHLIAFILCFVLFKMSDSFISLWLGQKYIIDKWVFIIMLLNTFILLERPTIDTYLSGYGLFSDVWAPWTEAFLNFGISLSIGYYWGIKGVVLGTLISMIVIVFVWKPYFLFKKGFKLPIWNYWREKIKILAAGFFSCLIAYQLSKLYTFEIKNFPSWIGLAIINTANVTILCSFFLYICTNGMKNLAKRSIHLVIKK